MCDSWHREWALIFFQFFSELVGSFILGLKVASIEGEIGQSSICKFPPKQRQQGARDERRLDEQDWKCNCPRMLAHARAHHRL